MGCFKHITYSERLQIEVMYNRLKYSATVIADTLGFHYSTIYREIKRGEYVRKVCYFGWDYRDQKEYSAEVAQKDYIEKGAAKGAPLKIGKDFELVSYIEKRIIEDKYSPAAVLGEIEQKQLPFKTTISKTTLYRYIDDDLFLNLNNKHLPTGKREKKHYNRVRRISANTPINKSIESRPADISERKAFGHWEMDTVVGGASSKTSASLLVLTERLTRKEVVMRLHRRTSACVVAALDKLQRRYGGKFSRVFKTITVDNGSEFLDCEGMEKGGRTQIYYCHPYSSYERGSNENANKLIRRFIPKGSNIARYSHAEIERLEYWINHYPRKIFGFKTSDDMYNTFVGDLSG